ncbi:hypothetical protein GF358_01875 [Candidatus Woesearchaeota archaeon]|nr:hypothetical protein [Candidatus Woesearchaeota archaeon]
MGILNKISRFFTGIPEDDIIECADRIGSGVSLRKIYSFLKHKKYSDKNAKKVLVQAITRFYEDSMAEYQAKLNQIKSRQKEYSEFSMRANGHKAGLEQQKTECIQGINTITRKRNSLLSELEIIVPS